MIKLTQEQELIVKKWAQEGYGLSNIQKSLREQFGISATYMDVRFLALDLGLELKEKVSAPTPQVAAVPPAVPGNGRPERGAAPLVDKETDPVAGGQVTVELDHVMRAGSIVSGTVKFSDGMSASWSLDQFGRLSLDPGVPGYSPSPQDIKVFQQELRRELEKRGF